MSGNPLRRAKMTTYEDAGVNVDLGNEVSQILYNAAKVTWANRKGRLGELIVPYDDFSGVRAINVSQLPEGTLMNMNFDGVGTKMELGERLNNHETIALDLFAMVCDDAVVRGAEPVLVGSVLDVNTLGPKENPYIEQVRQLAKGYINAAKAANVAIVNGEVAELGSRVGGYGPFNYNWSATVTWFAKRERLITGRKIVAGDWLVGLREEGFRSNGLSLVRKIMRDNHGEDWHKVLWRHDPEESPETTLADLALTPSRIYTAAVVEMFGGYDQEPKAKIHGVAHITGGGLPEKLGRVLKPSGLGAHIDAPFAPSKFMAYTQGLGLVPDEKAYQTWNMGQGMVIITPGPPDLDNVRLIASQHGIESKVIGRVVEDSGIRIRNEGGYKEKTGEYLTFRTDSES